MEPVETQAAGETEMRITTIRWIGPILFAALFASSASAMVTVEEVIRLHASGLSSQSLLLVVTNSDTPDTLSTDELTNLIDADVPDTVITIMVYNALSVMEDWKPVDLESELKEREYFEEDDDDVYSSFTLTIGGGWGSDAYWGWNYHYGDWPYYGYSPYYYDWAVPIYVGWWSGGWWGHHYGHHYGNYNYHYASYWDHHGSHHGYGYYPGYYGCQVGNNGYYSHYSDSRYRWAYDRDYGGSSRYRDLVEGNRSKGGRDSRQRDNAYPDARWNGSSWATPGTYTQSATGTLTRYDRGNTLRKDLDVPATRGSRDLVTKAAIPGIKTAGRNVLTKGKTPEVKSGFGNKNPTIKNTASKRTVALDRYKKTTTSKNKRSLRKVTRTHETTIQKLDRYKQIKHARRSPEVKSGKRVSTTPRANARTTRSVTSKRPTYSAGKHKSTKSTHKVARHQPTHTKANPSSTKSVKVATPAKSSGSKQTAQPATRSSGGRSATMRSGGSKSSSGKTSSPKPTRSSKKRGDRH